jgi:hypothetical protein
MDAGVPDQLPGVAARVSPSLASPETRGGLVLRGGSGSTTGVGAELAVDAPAEFDAVTSTRMVDPASETSST